MMQKYTTFDKKHLVLKCHVFNSIKIHFNDIVCIIINPTFILYQNIAQHTWNFLKVLRNVNKLLHILHVIKLLHKKNT